MRVTAELFVSLYKKTVWLSKIDFENSNSILLSLFILSLNFE
jgi:hypothetical protein